MFSVIFDHYSWGFSSIQGKRGHCTVQLYRIQCSVKLFYFNLLTALSQNGRELSYDRWDQKPRGLLLLQSPMQLRIKMKRRRDQTKWGKASFFLNYHRRYLVYIQSAGFYRISSFLVERHCPSQLRFSYQPSFILKVIIMVLGKKDRKDCKCTPLFWGSPACNDSLTILVMWSGC